MKQIGDYVRKSDGTDMKKMAVREKIPLTSKFECWSVNRPFNHEHENTEIYLEINGE
jgi:hypothetical protein